MYDETRTTLIGDGEESLQVSDGYVTKHKPKVGGYLVRYEDGYLSWTPAEPFESGYTLVDETGGG